MGLFDFMGGGGSKAKKLTRALTNPHVQHEERQRVMRKLAEIGDQEALEGLLMRFTYRLEHSINDEDEKHEAFELLCAAGDVALGPIEHFIAQYDAVYWPLKALRELAGSEPAVDLLLRVLGQAETKETRVNTHKAELVSNLRDFPHPRVQERLAALTNDRDEDVRIMAIDGLATYGEAVALEPMARRILDPEESPRVKTIIYEALLEQGWSLAPWQAEIREREILPSFYRLAASGKLERA
jgi:hypothetical protein